MMTARASLGAAKEVWRKLTTTALLGFVEYVSRRRDKQKGKIVLVLGNVPRTRDKGRSSGPLETRG